MDWYQKSLFKKSFRNKLDIYKNKIYQLVFNKILELQKNNKLLENNKYEFCFSDIKIILNINYKNNIDINKNFEINANYSQEDEFSKSGIFSIWNKTITINIFFGIKFNIHNVEELKIKLIDIIRHELEHMNKQSISHDVVDYDVSKIEDKNILIRYNESIKYLLSDIEIEPRIRGCMVVAKKYKIPIENFIIEETKRILYRGSKMVETEVEKIFGKSKKIEIENKIYNKFIRKIKELYPNVKIKQGI